MPVYEPDHLALFQRVFDEAWQEIGPAVKDSCAESAKTELARLIILAKPEDLKTAVLDHLEST
jgi:hypothetical protein